MTKIAFVPIDNRPICYDIVSDVLAIDSSIELKIPNINILGSLTESADIEGIFDFLNNLDDDTDYLIMSLDTLCYGGLVNSRRTNDDIQTLERRISKFKKILKQKKCKILAFSSIMRISNNNINEEEKEYWAQYGKNIFDYSYNYHKALKNKIPFPKSTIPSEILDDYLATRQRNFNINKLYIELARDVFFDTLVFSKDDCAQFGFNVCEAEILSKMSGDLDNVIIKTGADEIPLSLITRAILKDKSVRINPIFSYPNSINLISKYEDISVKNCVLGQIALAGLTINNSNPDLNFFINNFEYQQGDLVLGDVVNNNTSFNFDLDKPYFIADINNANGADTSFIQNLFNKINNNFYGYSAYNTSANSIGSSIFCAVVKYLSIKNNTYNDDAFKKIQFIRFLDDWAYQAVSRKDVRETTKSFDDALMDKISELNKNSAKIGNALNFRPKKITYSLPWNRSFEIRIKI